MTDSWVETTLGELCEIQGGGTPSTKEPAYWGGDVVWLTPTEVVKVDGGRIDTSERTITEAGLAGSSAKLLPADTVLLTTRASVGFTAIAGIPLATNQGFQSLIPSEAVLSEYLMLWIQGHRDEFASRAGGSTFPEISKTKVASIPITFPPLPVQRRIVDLLAHLDNHLANLQTERTALSDTRNATVRSHFTAAASGYESIGSLLSIRTGKLDVNQGSENGPFPFFTCSRDVHRIDWADFHGEAVVIAGNGDLNVRYFDGDFNAYQRTYVLQPLDSFTGNLKYIFLFFEHHISTLRINSSGSVIKYIKLGDLRDAQIPDRSRTEQKALVDSVFTADRLIGEIDLELRALRSLRSYLLSALLSGSYSISDQYDALLSEVA